MGSTTSTCGTSSVGGEVDEIFVARSSAESAAVVSARLSGDVLATSTFAEGGRETDEIEIYGRAAVCVSPAIASMASSIFRRPAILATYRTRARQALHSLRGAASRSADGAARRRFRRFISPSMATFREFHPLEFPTRVHAGGGLPGAAGGARRYGVGGRRAAGESCPAIECPPVSLMGPKPPLFSVVIPTYGRPRQLTACLQSLARLDDSRGAFEVIVVDDGSETPPQAAIAAAGVRLDVALLQQSHAGPAAARNAGALKARGAFLAFTDDDCQPAPDWLQHVGQTSGRGSGVYDRRADGQRAPR